MPNTPEFFSPSERAAAKARARAQDEALLRSGAISPGDLARINGGGDLAKGAIRRGRSAKAQRILGQHILAQGPNLAHPRNQTASQPGINTQARGTNPSRPQQDITMTQHSRPPAPRSAILYMLAAVLFFMSALVNDAKGETERGALTTLLLVGTIAACLMASYQSTRRSQNLRQPEAKQPQGQDT